MDVEKAARDFLRSAGLPCEFRAPESIPESLVTVRRTQSRGSSRFGGRALLKVQAWATTRGKAGELCEAAVSALVGRGDYEASGGLMAEHADITGCSVESDPFDWKDPEIKDRERWQATVSVDYNA